MRRTTLSTLALATLIVGAGVFTACTKKTDTTNTQTLNVNGTVINAAPNPGRIYGLSPAKGPAAGGTQVTITGEGFAESLQVFFGEVEAKSVQRKNDKEITATTPAGAKGTVDVILKSNTSPTSALQGGFTYE